MKEKERKALEERVLGNKRLGEIVMKYAFEISIKKRGQFLSLIEESYKVGFEDGGKK